jgi:hypothetical protein
VETTGVLNGGLIEPGAPVVVEGIEIVVISGVSGRVDRERL